MPGLWQSVFHRTPIMSDFFCPRHLNTWLFCIVWVCWLLEIGRMILIFYKETYFPGNTFKLHTDCECNSSPCAPPQIWLTLNDLLWSRLTHFICGLISALSLWGPLINRAGIRWKELFLEKKTTASAVLHIWEEMRWCPWIYPSHIWATRGPDSLSCDFLHVFCFCECWIFL